MLKMVLDCTSKGDRRFHPGVLTVTINGKTDTIDNFFNHSLRNKLGEPCGFDTADHFLFGGCDFPLTLCQSFYMSLWLQRIMVDRFLQSELVKYNDFFDGRNDGVNSQARAFRCFQQGGIKLLKYESSNFLTAYGRAVKKEQVEESSEERVVIHSHFPTYDEVIDIAKGRAKRLVEKEQPRDVCVKFVLKDFGFSNSKEVNVFDREKLHNIIGGVVSGYYDLYSKNVNEGYISMLVTNSRESYDEIKQRYIQS